MSVLLGIFAKLGGIFALLLLVVALLGKILTAGLDCYSPQSNSLSS